MMLTNNIFGFEKLIFTNDIFSFENLMLNNDIFEQLGPGFAGAYGNGRLSQTVIHTVAYFVSHSP